MHFDLRKYLFPSVKAFQGEYFPFLKRFGKLKIKYYYFCKSLFNLNYIFQRKYVVWLEETPLLLILYLIGKGISNGGLFIII